MKAPDEYELRQMEYQSEQRLKLRNQKKSKYMCQLLEKIKKHPNDTLLCSIELSEQIAQLRVQLQQMKEEYKQLTWRHGVY